MTQRTVAYQAPLSMDFPGKDTVVSCHFLLQGIFLTQGLTPPSLSSRLLHWQVDSLPLAPPGKPHSQQSLWRERAKGKVLCVLPPRQDEGWSHVEGWERPKAVAVHRENPRMRSFLLHMRLEKILES